MIPFAGAGVSPAVEKAGAAAGTRLLPDWITLLEQATARLREERDETSAKLVEGNVENPEFGASSRDPGVLLEGQSTGLAASVGATQALVANFAAGPTRLGNLPRRVPRSES